MNADIAAHPATFYSVTAILGVGFVGALRLLIFFFERRINEKFQSVEQHNTRQDERLNAIEGDLKRYDAHVAVGAQESTAIHEALQRVASTVSVHIEKEENVTWAKIDALVGAIYDMRLDNEKAHSGLVTGQSVLATRVDSLEKKMPNGELTKLAEAYHALAQRDLAGRTSRAKK